MLFALITHWNTDVVLIEDEIEGAGQALLVVPVPDFATQIGRFNSRSNIALAFLKGKSNGAGQTCSSKGIPCVAVVTYSHTDVFSVEEGSISACKAGLVAVECFAERIGGWDEGVGIPHALALVHNVTSVASSAFSSLLVPDSAVVRNGCADVISVGEESDRALEAVSIAIPGLASRVDLSSRGNDGASSVAKGISLIALFADSDVLIEDFALGVHLAADSFCVEVVVYRAFKAVAAFPLSASEMIVQDGQDIGVVGDEGLDLGARWRGKLSCE